MQKPRILQSRGLAGRDWLRAWCAGVLLGAACAGALAQQDYPSRPVRFVVGGGPDLLARITADKLASVWGKPVFVEQKNGASGALARDFVAQSAPDGSNWLLTTINYSAETILQKKPPGQADLVPVTMIATLPFVLVVNNELPVKSVQDLVALARAQPGKLNYASGGAGGPGHLAGEMLKQMAGIDVVHVPYKTVAQALADVMGNHAQFVFTPAPAALSLVRGGKLRAIAVSSPQRYGPLPDVPTVAEQGYPAYQLTSWNGIHVAAGTPPAILDRIAGDVAATMQAGDAREKAEAAGFEPVSMTRSAFEAFMREDIARVAKVIRDGNIQGE